MSVSVPSVLVPGFDLGLGEGEGVGHLCSIGHGEVLLHTESTLQKRQLAVTERRAAPVETCQLSTVNWCQLSTGRD